MLLTSRKLKEKDKNLSNQLPGAKHLRSDK